jgi:prepilin-type N-terminal cleavage/methylation domain-containing protein
MCSPFKSSCRSDRGAFTLIELLVACGIVAVLAGIGLGGVQYAVESAQSARVHSDLVRIAAALEEYRHRYGDFPCTDQPDEFYESLLGRRGPDGEPIQDPATIDVARMIVVSPVEPPGISPPMFLDPWRRPYVYIYKVPLAGWTNPSFVLLSAGPRGEAPAPLAPGGFPDPDVAANRGNIGWDGG